MKCLIVGDKPSRLNTRQHDAFIGARCEPRLRLWLDMLGIREPLLINRVDPRFKHALLVMKRQGYPVIALGVEASRACLGTKHFKLPHPSGRNRQLNNPEYVSTCIRRCKAFLDTYRAL